MSVCVNKCPCVCVQPKDHTSNPMHGITTEKSPGNMKLRVLCATGRQRIECSGGWGTEYGAGDVYVNPGMCVSGHKNRG